MHDYTCFGFIPLLDCHLCSHLSPFRRASVDRSLLLFYTRVSINAPLNYLLDLRHLGFLRQCRPAFSLSIQWQIQAC